MNSPCKDCVPPERHIGCHSTCQTYLDWKKELEEIKKKRRQLNIVAKKVDSNGKAYRTQYITS